MQPQASDAATSQGVLVPQGLPREPGPDQSWMLGFRVQTARELASVALSHQFVVLSTAARSPLPCGLEMQINTS